MARIEASVRAKQLVAAARSVLSREGVAKTPLRAVAAEGKVPLGTLQYAFPTREELLRKVIEDVVDEISQVFADSVHTGDGVATAIRHGLRAFWSTLAGNRDLQIMQYELTTYSLREPGQEDLARWQYESYTAVTARWCESAANSAGEVCAIPFDQLARIIVANIDGLILQFICDPDTARADRDLDTIIEMLVTLAAPAPR
ncbi:TetR/AcrR family transcriptional regulator [Gordonia neofelifaecis]|uniref:TetR family transcriptional regulator n=1 Tax=Gordonia neofelifaecis NRRL B-59395 TaxID=644548 RepID=F1YFE9_9ACTN|nr:TetR/AcrR family transcriptional regulator [Gordonia neofelifaecis]EGD56437.1 TetR family transcriptional regulator [Gordonia neofelifaecis NRRL B-59395]